MTDTTHGGNMPIIWKTLIIIPVIAVCVAAGAVGYVAYQNTKIEISWKGEAYINTESAEARYQREQKEAEEKAKAKQPEKKKITGPSSIHLDGVSQ